MKIVRLSACCAAALAAAVGAWAATPPDDATAMQQEKDRAAIEALMWRYVRALDTLDANAYASAYTEDGMFRAGDTQHKGRDAMRKMIDDLKQARTKREANGEKSAAMYHVIANHDVEFADRDHARYYSYWMTVFAGTSPQSPPRVAAVGHGVDELVRVNGQWLIASRDVAPTD